MSRLSDVTNKLELAAKKLGMTIEEAVDVLLGIHKTHTVVQAHATLAQKVAEETKVAAAPSSEPETKAE
jgi:phage-related minor tail protein